LERRIGKKDWREGGDMRFERRTKYEFGEKDGKRDWRDISNKEETKSFTLSFFILYILFRFHCACLY
jgi:hypothetical protein